MAWRMKPRSLINHLWLCSDSVLAGNPMQQLCQHMPAYDWLVTAPPPLVTHLVPAVDGLAYEALLLRHQRQLVP